MLDFFGCRVVAVVVLVLDLALWLRGAEGREGEEEEVGRSVPQASQQR